MRHAGMEEMSPRKDGVHALSPVETETQHVIQAMRGSPMVEQEAESVGMSLDCVLHGKKQARQGEQFRVGWAG